MSDQYVYMCGVAWDTDLFHAPHAVEFFPSVEVLKADRECWKECGIVRLKVTLEEWVEEQNLFEKSE